MNYTLSFLTKMHTFTRLSDSYGSDIDGNVCYGPEHIRHSVEYHDRSHP